MKNVNEQIKKIRPPTLVHGNDAIKYLTIIPVWWTWDTHRSIARTFEKPNFKIYEHYNLQNK